MTEDTRLDVLARGWRGRLFAALVALIAGLPGLLAVPALDRDEARFAQSSAQMLETGNFIDIRYRDQARAREPIGLHWLQAASVSAASSVEARRIWAYRLPSLLGAMLAAAACAWGATVFFGPGGGCLAGAILGGCLILSTEAGIAKTDALLCGATTLALAALAHLYAAAQTERNEASEADAAPPATRTARLVFWLALSLAVMDKGLAGLVVVTLTGLTLWACDRRAPWARSLDWTWGLILLAALVGPWLAAVTVRTDGLAWSGGPPTDLAGVGPGGRAPLGLHMLASPVLLFPFAALLPAALVEAWKARAEPGPRFTLCWLIPNWLVLEAQPIRLVHDALPLYGALAWLAAFAVSRPLGRFTRWAGAALSILAALALAGGAALLADRYGGDGVDVAAVVAGLLALGAGAAGALAMAPRHRLRALAAAGGLGVVAHGAVAAGLAPRLAPLWLSGGVVAVLDRSGLNPQKGLTPGPVTVVGYAEPSLVFALGTQTELGDVDDAAEAISEGRPVVIEQSAAPAFRHALAEGALKASLVGQISGLDYVDGRATLLDVYRSDSPPPADAVNNAASADQPPASEAPAPPSPNLPGVKKPSEKRP